MCSQELAPQLDPTGRARLESGLDRDERNYPAVKLAHLLDEACYNVNGRALIRPGALRLVIARHWSKISLLAHQIHAEEKASR